MAPLSGPHRGHAEQMRLKMIVGALINADVGPLLSKERGLKLMSLPEYNEIIFIAYRL